MMIALLVTLAALPVLWRVGRILAHMSRSHFRDPVRFQGFALGYSLLGALTVHAVLAAWFGGGVDWHDAGFIAASALLILTDRRSRTR